MRKGDSNRPRCFQPRSLSSFTSYVLNGREWVILCVAGVLQQLQEGREQLEDLWSVRKMKLDLCLQLRMFEREALEVRSTPPRPRHHPPYHPPDP